MSVASNASVYRLVASVRRPLRVVCLRRSLARRRLMNLALDLFLCRRMRLLLGLGVLMLLVLLRLLRSRMLAGAHRLRTVVTRRIRVVMFILVLAGSLLMILRLLSLILVSLLRFSSS